MRSTSLFGQDETPRGERECGGRLRPSPDWGFKGLRVKGLRVKGLRVKGVRVKGLRVKGVRVKVLRKGLKPARVETRTRLDAQARKPGHGALAEGCAPCR